MSAWTHPPFRFEPLPPTNPDAALEMMRRAMCIGAIHMPQDEPVSRPGRASPFTSLLRDLHYRKNSRPQWLDRREVARNTVGMVDAYTARSDTGPSQFGRDYYYRLGNTMLIDAKRFKLEGLEPAETIARYHPFTSYEDLVRIYAHSPHIGIPEIKSAFNVMPQRPKSVISACDKRIRICRDAIPGLQDDHVWKAAQPTLRPIYLPGRQTKVQLITKVLEAFETFEEEQLLLRLVQRGEEQDRQDGILKPLKRWQGLGNMGFAFKHLALIRTFLNRGEISAAPDTAVSPDKLSTVCEELPRALAHEKGDYARVIDMDLPQGAAFALHAISAYNAVYTGHHPLPSQTAHHVRLAVAYLSDVAKIEQYGQPNTNAYEMAKWYNPQQLADQLEERYGLPVNHPLFRFVQIDASWAHRSPSDILPADRKVQPVLQKKA